MSYFRDDAFAEPFASGFADPDDAYDAWRDEQEWLFESLTSELYLEQTISERFWRQPDGALKPYHRDPRLNDGSPF